MRNLLLSTATYWGNLTNQGEPGQRIMILSICSCLKIPIVMTLFVLLLVQMPC